MKNEAVKQKLIEEIREVPIVSVVCKKAGIARATFYRWKNEDRQFAAEIQKSMDLGIDQISDVAESQVLNLIRKGSFPASRFWLVFHREPYMSREIHQRFTKKEEREMKQFKIGMLDILEHIKRERIREGKDKESVPPGDNASG